MERESKKEIKKAVKDIKRLVRVFKDDKGPIMFVQTNYNVFSAQEIAARYLRMNGYPIELNYGTNSYFRTLSIEIV